MQLLHFLCPTDTPHPSTMSLTGTSSRVWPWCRMAWASNTAGRPLWPHLTVPGATTRPSWISSLAIDRCISGAPPSFTPREPMPSVSRSWVTTATGSPDASYPPWNWRRLAGESYLSEVVVVPILAVVPKLCTGNLHTVMLQMTVHGESPCL